MPSSQDKESDNVRKCEAPEISHKKVLRICCSYSANEIWLTHLAIVVAIARACEDSLPFCGVFFLFRSLFALIQLEKAEMKMDKVAFWNVSP